jgi:hypothetical protein
VCVHTEGYAAFFHPLKSRHPQLPTIPPPRMSDFRPALTRLPDCRERCVRCVLDVRVSHSEAQTPEYDRRSCGRGQRPLLRAHRRQHRRGGPRGDRRRCRGHPHVPPNGVAVGPARIVRPAGSEAYINLPPRSHANDGAAARTAADPAASPDAPGRPPETPIRDAALRGPGKSVSWPSSVDGAGLLCFGH